MPEDPSPIELNASDEATVGPIRESLRAAEKIRALRYPDAEVDPPSSVLPTLAARQGKILGFNATTGAPEPRDMLIDNIVLGSDATGDIYYRNASGDLTRLPIGTAGHALRVSGGIPDWQAVVSAIADLNLGTGATGDIYYRNSSGVLVKLAIGTTGQVLKVVGGLPVWDDEAGGGGGSIYDEYEYGPLETTNATVTDLPIKGQTVDTSAAYIALPFRTISRFEGIAVASAENGTSWTSKFSAAIRHNGAGDGFPAIIDTSQDIIAESGASAWELTIDIWDQSRLRLRVKGAASTWIEWHARIQAVFGNTPWDNPFP